MGLALGQGTHPFSDYRVKMTPKVITLREVMESQRTEDSTAERGTQYFCEHVQDEMPMVTKTQHYAKSAENGEDSDECETEEGNDEESEEDSGDQSFDNSHQFMGR